MININTQADNKGNNPFCDLVKKGAKTQWRETIDTKRRVRSGMDHPDLSVGYRAKVGDDTYIVITGIRYERLQNISEADAIAEGVECIGHEPMIGFGGTDLYKDYSKAKWGCWTAKDSFKSLVIATHGLGFWEKNHWVWVISFKTEKRG